MLMVDGQVEAEFLKMCIPHPRMSKAHRIYDNLRQMKVLAPNKPQRCACLFAPTHSGKSKTVETYIENQIVDELIAEGLFPAEMDRSEIARLQRRALHVTLESKATPKSAASDILTEFNDPHASHGTATSLLSRVYHHMRKHGTQILFLDEIQHMDHRQTEKDNKPRRAGVCESTAVTDTLKTMLIRGLVPIVFVGIDDAESMILGDQQLAARCITKIDFRQLRNDVPEDLEIFLDYLGMLGIKLMQHGLMKEISDLLEGKLPAVIHAVASGRLGVASKLVAAACTIARERKAARVLAEHVSAAIDEWAIPMEMIDYNPIAQGLRDYERRAA
ncbi:hypothetical protein EET67_03065 [Pseudaminobacter arsenicus]|uniref:Uncharacterized protein n=1 Tax=Borborobacter arsenicus TaxID=1851146 RepID=A0A432VCK0_9HYPH|nr:TniB family NTP-binding protein [Pseudaminobacter arsenicus]RUM99879.1 hypothetical protein EET67_03065 [Pseudaminobacter arsenicus]